MWQRIYNYLHRRTPIFAPVHDGNVIVITANVRAGTISVAHKGRVRTGKFNDSTLRQMVKNVRFRKNAEMFLGCVGSLLEKLIADKEPSQSLTKRNNAS